MTFASGNRPAALLVALLAAMMGAALPALSGITKAPAPPVKSGYDVETVAGGLVHPWALQFLSDGRMLVTERPGRLRLVAKDGALSPAIEGVPKVVAIDQAGLLDVALDPDFDRNGLVYLTFSEPRGDGLNGTSVARGRLVLAGVGGKLEDIRIIFRQQPASTGGLHFGSRIAFADDGTLFVTLGERFQRDFAQDLSRHWGKVVRIRPDGQIPADNPTFSPPAAPGIWSYGHRNPQSAAIHPTTRKLWIVEHGPKGGDEINVPLKGRNYGWPVIGYGIDYSGAKIHDSTHRDGMEQPIYHWTPSIAPSGMAFYTGDKFPGWQGNLFVGALAGRHLARLVLDGETIVAEERLLTELGERIRDVRQGPDGFLYVLTDSPNGRILRLRPKA
jgi:aldose sugar dehydrogenase